MTCSIIFIYYHFPSLCPTPSLFYPL